MPKFEIVSKEHAEKKTLYSGKRAEIISLYLFFIDELKEGKAGRLQPGEGETVQAVRRRLGAAAKVAGKKLEIRRVGNEVYFWLDSGTGKKNKKRGRPKKVGEQSQNNPELTSSESRPMYGV